jgi:hypothetical protein
MPHMGGTGSVVGFAGECEIPGDVGGFAYIEREHRSRELEGMSAAMTTAATEAERYFDLNIEKVLEHWSVSFAIREVIANALDEQAITGSDEPEMVKIGENTWQISDFGRGLRYQHLTQKENAEKRRYPDVIGQFGMGLKDALAVFDRRGVQVLILSPHGDISTVGRPKEGFGDITTLHARVGAPSEPERIGTTFVLRGVRDDDVDAAKQFFLRYGPHRGLESTEYGHVLDRPPGAGPANIYVKGLLVAQEDNFLFSYNITSLTKGLRQALNRERSNVGRGAYTDRVKAILKQCQSAEVARSLAEDLGQFASGRMHDELSWNEVSLHACRILASHERVVFVTAHQLAQGGAQIDYARYDGYRLVLVPDSIAYKLRSLKDLEGNSILDLDGYRDEYNRSFEFDFVEPATLKPAEAHVYALTDRIVAVSGVTLDRVGVGDILISNTMRLNESGHQVVGMFDTGTRRVVIRRDRLGSVVDYSGTLLHELTHANSGAADGTLAFEEALTQQLGVVVGKMVADDAVAFGGGNGAVRKRRSRT